MSKPKTRGATRRTLQEILQLPPEALLTPVEAAEYVRSTAASLAQRRTICTGPEYLKNGYLIRYRRGSLDAWLQRDLADRPAQRGAIAVEAAA